MPYRQFCPVQHGTGAPSSGAGTTGAASAEIAQVRPTIRNNILTARFMGVSPSTGPLGAATLWHGLYKVVSSDYCEFCNSPTARCRWRGSTEELRIQLCIYLFNDLQKLEVRTQTSPFI